MSLIYKNVNNYNDLYINEYAMLTLKKTDSNEHCEKYERIDMILFKIVYNLSRYFFVCVCK